MQASDFLSRCVLGTTGLGGVWGKIDPTELRLEMNFMPTK
jgi:hypothetical protein